MANQEHVDLLKQGVEQWSAWRQKSPGIRPDLRGADLRETKLNRAWLSGANLNDANLRSAELGSANLSDADLFDADLFGADLFGADLSDANLGGAHLHGANLYSADLMRANLRGADLSCANLIVSYLNGADLYGADLNGAHLYGANLRGADLSDADLYGADLRGADLSDANLSRTNLNGANLNGADLRGATLLSTDLTGATLTGCAIYGISVWNVQLEGAKQDSLVITPPHEPSITIDDLEVAQFIYLLLNHKKLRNVLNAVTARGVLLLGRFGGGGLEVLQAVAARLREEKYLPIIFDFERPQDRDYTETVKTLAGLARFIIVDLSGPSIPQELSHTVPFFDIPFVPILEKGRNKYAMFVDLLKYPWVLKPPVEFADVNDLLERLPSEVIAPAEERHRARQQLLDELFHLPKNP